MNDGTDLIGHRLSHYRILEKLGSGGMGEVYLAEDDVLKRRVALKILPPQLAANPERLERFRREIRILATLNHPNITTIHSVEEAGDVRYFTMEVVEGRVLSRIIRPSGVSLDEFFRLAIPLVDAVKAAHAQQITHRDLKPGNVMVSREGRVKVLDFGLAKIRKPVWQSEAFDDVTRPGRYRGEAPLRPARHEAALTEDGRVLGTGPYMSPEQVRGGSADTRSDVFALGILFYEMLTGTRPFQGRTQVDLLSSILRDAPDLCVDEDRFPQHLAQIVARCLEKDQDDRYQDAGEVYQELRTLKKDLQVQEILKAGSAAGDSSRRVPRPTFTDIEQPRSKKAPLLLLASFGSVVLMVTVGLALLWLQTTRKPTPESPVDSSKVETPQRATLAVFYFDNISGHDELDWMRMGLSDMLVTDLSRSRQVAVISTNRLYQLLKEGEHLGRDMFDWETVRSVAMRAGADMVVVGSFVMAGDTLQINIQLQEVESGDILMAEPQGGLGAESIFDSVQELGRRIRLYVELTGDTPALTQREDLPRLATSSVNASRYFYEASQLYMELKFPEALSLYEEAIEADPEYAVAYAALSTVYGSLGHQVKAREYARRALELDDRLPDGARYYAEGNFYGAEWSTYGRAIEALERALQVYPADDSLRSLLSKFYLWVERYEDAVTTYQAMLRPGYTFAGDYNNLAQAYGALGRFEQGKQVLEGFIDEHPDSWLATTGLGWHLAHWERFDEARAVFEQAEKLRPGDYFIRNGEWRLCVLAEQWDEVEALARNMMSSGDSYWQWQGLVSQARNRLYFGRAAEAVKILESSTEVFAEAEPSEAMSHGWASHLWLEVARPDKALEKAAQARKEGEGQWPERFGIYLASLASEDLGRRGDADRLARLLDKVRVYPNAIEKRRRHLLAGHLHLRRGNTRGALEQFSEAEKLLPPRGIPTQWHVLPDHVPVWYALAQAELAAGRVDRAAVWLERVTRSGLEHIEFPVRYVRSFYLLAKLREEQGKDAEARELYQRFADFWFDGDLDREQVKEAIRKSGASASPDGERSGTSPDGPAA